MTTESKTTTGTTTTLARELELIQGDADRFCAEDVLEWALKHQDSEVFRLLEARHVWDITPKQAWKVYAVQQANELIESVTAEGGPKYIGLSIDKVSSDSSLQ